MSAIPCHGRTQLGTQPFGSLDLLVRAPVLIPRPETEDWTLRLADLLRSCIQEQGYDGARSFNVLDLCTGTGCIPLLLASTLPKGSVRALGVDINPQAVGLASENARLCALSDVATFEERDLFASDDFEPADVLTANPPYIPGAEYAVLPRSVLVFEDRGALLGDDGAGLRFYPRIASMLPRWVKPGGIAAVEVGKGQSDAVRDIFLSHCGDTVERVEVWDDPWGVPRTVVTFLR
ncbi:S-adenosyl-L-methionine-dependent methyltransferase [Auricularia subglabra TFB-10046 SS5]|uniref:peptide chain release factor N(5)-glutamine methyltransferase n=1 Tax=Auricularia subglabra (strain TFB-10046 / SS5) TaxID=717982 RepID=J0CX71_AURST|nr:S-adenosyl-L-methionine-dependent methyltransferase [Auricularia subglabra TFB-10046 SS5]